MKLPISYFDKKMTGDLLQRINDHHRIESFLFGGTLSTIFSILNLLIFSIVLLVYSPMIFFFFWIGSIFFFLWIVFFMKKRAEIDYRSFHERAANQGREMELIQGMQEIKLHNAERQKRWQWELIQIRIFKLRIRSLAISQFQNTGSSIINEGKNLLISFYSSLMVINGELSLGSMLSISYIVGQLNGPISELISFMHQLQDAKLSFQRLNEIHSKPDEESSFSNDYESNNFNGDIEVKNCSFRYDLNISRPILDNVSFKIPYGKVTAIVGSSGSGKTTLMKLLIKFYEPEKGEIIVGGKALNTISHSAWRNAIGVVMQEGFIFSESIAKNIAVRDLDIDNQRLIASADKANILEFIQSLPLGFNTKIGNDGTGLSSGQKQRILIARAIYRNPEILFLDEATSSLDANNEKRITQNIQDFFVNKTVVVIAHRLSTVKKAHQIVVLGEGGVLEIGNHLELIQREGVYYRLVKNQLDINE
jgi:ATP-binding cassette subfamily B protein